MNTPPSPPGPPAGPGPDFPHGLDPKRLFQAVATPTEGAPGGSLHRAPDLDEVAAAFPQLEILALLGAGGMGAVFKARQPALDRFVALKILPAGLLASDPAFAERFAREGRLLARLNHPNIVAVHDFGRAGPFFYLLMEYVDGVNLRQAMRANRFTPDQALALVPRICEALQFAHDEGVLHRDIKPENILLDARGRVKLADFGIAKLAGTADPTGSSGTWTDPGLTQAGSALGTPSYMAPEQREHPGAVDHRADIYSLGVVFYELLTGELPTGKFAPPSATAAVDARIDAIVQRALEKDRALRQQSAREMRTQVEDVTLGATKPLGVGVPQNHAAAASAGASTAQSAIASTPRWSGQAVAGGVLTGLSLLPALIVPLVLGWMLSRAVPHGHGVSPDQAKPLFAGVLFCLPALVMGLAGTILGWLGLRQVRMSGGVRKGRGLGMFAALTWPLLFAGILEALILGRTMFILPRGSGIGGALSLVLWLVVFVGTCVFAIAQTRRWLNRGAAAAVGAGGKSASSSGCWIALAVAAVVLISLFGLFGCYFLAHRTVRPSDRSIPEFSPFPEAPNQGLLPPQFPANPSESQRQDASLPDRSIPAPPATPEAPAAPAPPAAPR